MSYFDKVSLGMLFNQGYLSPTAVSNLMEQTDKPATIGIVTPEKKLKPANHQTSPAVTMACCKA